ncbi:T1SS-143 repeat domain-containing protein, partial [Bosea sp. LC85]|uniref:T1SS-143 repeat domain-containing protein n=1 Tax=Bosea sp. LC85 TaxID=1502851 RepID=UPI0005BA32F6
NLASGSTPAGPDFAANSISFTAGSDAIASIVFATDLALLGGGLSWTRLSDTQIVGKDGAATIVTLDLSVAGSVATVTATLNGNYDSHPGLNADDLAALGSVGVVATDIDGTTAIGTVNVAVSDDVPTVTALPPQTAPQVLGNYVVQAGNADWRGLDGTDNHDILLTGFVGASHNGTADSVNSNNGSIGVGNHFITGATNQKPQPDGVRVDFVDNVQTVGSGGSATYTYSQHYSATSTSFVVDQVQGGGTAVVFVQLWKADNDPHPGNFSDDQRVGIASVTVNGAAPTNFTAVYEGGTLIGYVFTDVPVGATVVVNGAADFNRLIVQNYDEFSFSNAANQPTQFDSGRNFTISGVTATIQVVQPFEVRHDESASVNNGADPNLADDTAAALPAALSGRIGQLGFVEIGHAVSTASASSLFTYAVGADQLPSGSAITYRLSTNVANGTFNGADSGLTTTNGNLAIHLYSDPTNPLILWGVAGGLAGDAFATGTKVFAAYIDDSGKLWLTQFEAIAHGVDGSTPATHDDAASVIAGLVYITATVTDADNDSVSAVSQTPIKLTFQDDGPNAVNDAGQTVAEDAAGTIGGNLLTNDTQGADGATLTHVQLPGSGVLVALTTGVLVAGAYQFTTALGVYSFQANGAWSFDPAPGQANAAGISAGFTYRITDGDGDTDTAVQPITVTDGAGPVAGAAISLTLDDQNLASGSTPAGPDSASNSISFTAGSDAIASIVFATDLATLGGGLSWTRVSGTQIVGKDGAATIVTLDLSVAGNVATVTATLNGNYDSHPGLNADDLAALGSVGVIATDVDGDFATGTVNVAVSDDVPTLAGAAQLGQVSESGLGSGVPLVQSDFGNLNIAYNADRPGRLEFARDNTNTLIKPAGLSSDGVALDYILRTAANGVDEELVAFKIGADANSPVFIVTLNALVNPAYAFSLHQNLDHSGVGADTQTLSFSIVAYDSDGDAVTQTLTVAVLDDVPVAAADTDAVAAGSFAAVGGDVIAGTGSDGNAAGADTRGADGATVTSVAATTAGGIAVAVGSNTVVAGQYGVLTISSDGSYSYIRNVGSAGGVSDVFSYTLSDGDGDASPTTLTIAIGDSTPAATIPGAGGATTTVHEAGLPARGAEAAGSNTAAPSETVAGTIGFSSPDGVSLVSLGGHVLTGAPQSFADGTRGTLTASYSYDPATGAGTISYSYTLLDNTAGDNTTASFALVVSDADGDPAPAGSLVINIVDDAPDAVGDAGQTVAEDAAGTIGGNLLTNDTQGADGATLTHVQLPGSGAMVPLTTGVLVGGAYQFTTALGVYSFQANGAWAFDPAPGQANAAGISAGFSYQIIDGDGDTDAAVQPITVTDGAGPVAGAAISLMLDDQNLASGSTPAGPDFA